MSGNATLTIVASRNASSAPNDATSNAPVRLTRRSRSSATCCDETLRVDGDGSKPRQRRGEPGQRLLDRGLARLDEPAAVAEMAQLPGGNRAELRRDQDERRRSAVGADPCPQELDRAHDRGDRRRHRPLALLRDLVRLDPAAVDEADSDNDVGAEACGD